MLLPDVLIGADKYWSLSLAMTWLFSFPADSVPGIFWSSCFLVIVSPFELLKKKQHFVGSSEVILMVSLPWYATFGNVFSFFEFFQALIGGLSLFSGSLILAGLTQLLVDIFPRQQT
jgi:hypothetical protein